MSRAWSVIFGLLAFVLFLIFHRTAPKTVSEPSPGKVNWIKWQTILLGATALSAIGGGYLYYRQNEELQTSIDSQAYQGIITTEFDGLLTVLQHQELQDPYLEAFLVAAHCKSGDLSPADKVKYIGAIILFEFFNNIHIQSLKGAVSNDLWTAWLKDIDLFLAGYPAMTAIWVAGLRDIYNEDFVTTIDERPAFQAMKDTLAPATTECLLPRLDVSPTPSSTNSAGTSTP